MFSFIFLLLVNVSASWLSQSVPAYAKWSDDDLRVWLEQHSIKVPPEFDKPLLYALVNANWQSPLVDAGRHWSLDLFNRAQRAFQHIKHDSFDSWDESRLRVFLLEHGVVAPSGPREQLIVLAKSKYREYTDAAALYSSLASASVSSAYPGATDATHPASQCISTTVAQATHEVARAFDDTRDYTFSAWDGSQLRNWLKEHGVIEAKSAGTKEELLSLASNYYRKTTSAMWESWSDSYMREWLIAHNLLKPTDTLSRSTLLGQMKKYYYNYTDSVWHAWSDSELRAWLVDHGLLKSNAEKNRDELIKMLEVHYSSAIDTIWGAWTDSDIREWLAEHEYLDNRSGVKNRKDLVDLINNKYPNASKKAASYLAWPDARLRAYLRERGINEDVLPTNRPGLLQETRIRWVQTTHRAESLYSRLKEIINNSVEAGEEKVARILEILSGDSRDAAQHASAEGARECADMKKTQGWGWGSHKVEEGDEAQQHAKARGEL